MRIVTVVLLGLLLLSGCSLLTDGAGPGGGNTGSRTDEPIGDDPGDPGDPGQPPPGNGDGALRETPDPAIVDARGTGADHFAIGPDGRTLVVYWWGGTPGCFGLKEVMVEVQRGVPIVTVLEGTHPEAQGQPCTMEAVLKSAVVELPEQILVDGSGNNHPAGEPMLPPEPVRVEPVPGVVDARPHAMTGYRLSGDGLELTVHYVGGTEECYALGGVDIEPAGGGTLTVVTVTEGRLPDAEGACEDIGVSKAVTVTLDSPLIVQATFDS